MPRSPLPLLVLFFLILSCASPTDDQAFLHHLHQLRAEALQKGDLTLFDRIISPHYHDDKGGKMEKLASIRESLSRRSLVSVRFDSPRITSDGRRGEIVSRYRMRVRVNGTEMEFVGEERLLVEKEGMEWRVVGGL
ncbi:MAG: hypothetical protein Fur0034_16860 [Desulfuromonadia bacterium]